MSREKHDDRRWPTPLKPIAADDDLYNADLLDPAIRKNDAIQLVINMVSPGKAPDMKKATFGAGCFWHVEDAFCHVPGVISTQAGYMGGMTENPTYREVCTDKTGHAEVVEVTYDPAKVSYDRLLDVFWNIHDPTQTNRQGPDIGTQYRSVIFYHDQEQQRTATASKEQQQRKLKKAIATLIEPIKPFYRAEEYHQQYFKKTGKRVCDI